MSPPQPPLYKRVGTGLGLLAAYFGTAEVGLLLATINHNASPVWPASGLAVAGLRLLGVRYAWLVWLGAFAANARTGSPFVANALIATGNTLEAVCGALLLRRSGFGQASRALDVVVTTFVAPLAAACMGTLALVLVDITPVHAAPEVFITWWVGDALGVVVVAPLLLTGWRAVRGELLDLPLMNAALVWEALATAAGVGVMVWVVIWQMPHVALLYMLFPVLLGVVLRWGSLLGHTLTALVCAVSVLATLHGMGPFHEGTLNQNLICMQLFVATLAVTAVALPGFSAGGSMRTSALVLVTGWSLTAGAAYAFHQSETQRDNAHLATLLHDAQEAIRERLEGYEDLLRGGASLFAVHPQISQIQWENYVDALDVQERFPGLMAMSVVRPVPAAQREQALAALREEWGPSITLHRPMDADIPANPNDDLAIVTRVAPVSVNHAAVGRDVATESRRRRAFTQARVSGDVVMSRPLQLGSSNRRSVLLVMPLYSDATRNPSKLTAWLVAALAADDVFKSLSAGKNGDLALSAFAGDKADAGSLVYSTSGIDPLLHSEFTRLMVGQSPMMLGWSRGPSFVSAHDTGLAWVTASGTLLTLLLGLLVATQGSLMQRAQSLADAQTERLRLTQERFRRALAASADGLWEINLLNNKAYFSPRFLELMGYDSENFSPDRNWFLEHVHPDDRPVMQAAVDAHFNRETPIYALEYRVHHRDGSWRWFLMKGQVSRGERGEPVWFAGSASDNTERRQAEEELIRAKEAALSGTRAKSAFLANMSHEIRTPMNGVIGVTELLMGMQLPDEARSYVELIRTSGNALLTVINDILDLSKIEAGKLLLEREAFNFPAVLQQRIAMLATRIAAQRLHVEQHLPGDMPTRLVGDSGRIGQVLTNLLGNAVKFTEDGRIDVFVSWAAQDDNQLLVRVAIRDTGAGVAPEVQKKLFDPFTQGDDSNTRRHGGTGLGLSICKRLCEAMGGNVGMESVVGQGSTFWFTVLVGVAHEHAAPHEQQPATVAPRGAGEHILVAEDNEINRIIVVRMLADLGYQADVAINGREAVSALERKHYDLVLMDCQMPEMDGFEAAAAIRKMSRLPIVALTANAMQEDLQRCFAAGMDDVATKPFKREDLAAKVNKWLHVQR